MYCLQTSSLYNPPLHPHWGSKPAEGNLPLQSSNSGSSSIHLPSWADIVGSLTASHSCIYPVPNVFLDIQLLVLGHVGDLVELQLHDLLHLHSATHCHHLRHLQLKALYLSHHINIVIPLVCSFWVAEKEKKKMSRFSHIRMFILFGKMGLWAILVNTMARNHRFFKKNPPFWAKDQGGSESFHKDCKNRLVGYFSWNVRWWLSTVGRVEEKAWAQLSKSCHRFQQRRGKGKEDSRRQVW